MKEMIYLDNAATTFPKSENVYNIMDWIARNRCVNAGRGGYKWAREATKLIDDTRNELLKLLQISTQRDVIFTPSATLALNQIIFGLEWDQFKNIYVTPFEHNAIMRPLHKISEMYGIKIHIIPFIQESWELDTVQLEKDFSINNPDYIFMSHMSNVTGYILPCEQVIEMAYKYKSVNIIDCSQSLGTIPISKSVLEADFLVFAGHKSLYGPMGIGGFIAKKDNQLNNVILGGTGTESLNLDMPKSGTSRYEVASYNIQAIAGLLEAIKWIEEQGTAIYEHKKELTNYLINELKNNSCVTVYLPEDMDRHCGIVSFTADEWNADDIGLVLDEDFDIAVRTGYHCSPLIHDFIGTREYLGTVRVSLGFFNTKDDIDKLIKAINEIL